MNVNKKMSDFFSPLQYILKILISEEDLTRGG